MSNLSLIGRRSKVLAAATVSEKQACGKETFGKLFHFAKKALMPLVEIYEQSSSRRDNY